MEAAYSRYVGEFDINRAIDAGPRHHMSAPACFRMILVPDR